MSDSNTLSRQQLYDLVWKSPVDKLAEELGITGPWLGKVCKQYRIPVPPRGYWARVAAGRSSAPPPLIGANDLPEAAIVMPAARKPKPPSAPSGESPPAAPLQPLWREQAARIGNVRVPEKLSRPHPIVAERIAAAHPQKNFRGDRRRSIAHANEIGATPLEFRRLRILSVLFRHLEAIGFKISVGAGTTDFVARKRRGEVTFRLTEWIREYRRPLTPVEARGAGYKHRKTRQIREATGLLELRITSRQPDGVPDRWQEIERTIEETLPEIIAAITTPFEIARQQREKRAAQRKMRLEIREQAGKWAEEEGGADAARKEKLRDQVGAWRQANDLRNFVTAVRRAVLAGSSFVPKDQLEDWTAWVLQQADELDPLCEVQLDGG